MLALSIILSVLALGTIAWLTLRVARLEDDLRHVHRTSRANADRAEELLEQLRKELLEKMANLKPARAASAAGPSWFSPRMTIGDALKQHPGVKDVLASMHIGGCSSCSASESETLEQAAAGHRVDLDEMLDKMNALMTSPAGVAPAPAAEPSAEEKARKAAAALPPANGGRVLLGITVTPSAPES